MTAGQALFVLGNMCQFPPDSQKNALCFLPAVLCVQLEPSGSCASKKCGRAALYFHLASIRAFHFSRKRVRECSMSAMLDQTLGHMSHETDRWSSVHLCVSNFCCLGVRDSESGHSLSDTQAESVT